jgi:hypothetical protein
VRRAILALLATLPWSAGVCPEAKADANPQPHLLVRSSGDCPSGQAVAEALWAIRPDDEWPELRASIGIEGDSAQVSLNGDEAHRRQIAVPSDCADRANRVALVIAVWSGELSARAAEAPSFSVSVPAPVPARVPLPAKKSAMVAELGVAGFYSMVGGAVPGAKAEVGMLRRGGWWGFRATAGYQSAKSLRVDIGGSDYDRTLLGAAVILQRDRPRFFLSSDWGLAGAFVRARGDGYSQNQSASGLNVGLIAVGRAGASLGRFRIWADLSVYRWLRRQTIEVDPLMAGTPTRSTLPSWDAHAGIGAGIVFD